MKMRLPTLALMLLLSAFPVEASAGDEQATEITVPDAAAHRGDAKPWSDQVVLDSESRFNFAIMADRTGGERPGVFPQGVEAINRLQPAFVMSVGDYISGWKGDTASLEQQWDRFIEELGPLDAPFFATPGNHDFQNAQTEREWKERFGRSYYHFLYKDTLFITLNSELIAYPQVDAEDLADDPKQKAAWRASGHVASERAAMMDSLGRVLADNPDVRWTFVFMHQGFWRGDWAWPAKDPETGERDFSDYPMEGPWPRWNHDDNPYWQRVQALLSGRDYSLFAGHNHDYAYVDASSGGHRHDHVTLATTGGSTNMRGPGYGEFDHVMWVTMTDDGPVFANLLLDGILPLDVPTPDNRPPFID